MFWMKLGVFVKWRTVLLLRSHKMALVRKLSCTETFSVKPSNRQHHRSDGEWAACSADPPLRRPRDRHTGTRAAAAPRPR